MPTTKLLLCEECTPTDGRVNHVTGCIFVGWGHGWQPCFYCGGSGLDPAYVWSVEWLVNLIKTILPLAAGAQAYAEAR